MPVTKRAYIKSYGCQMNVYDALRMADILRPLGYQAAETPEAADLVILNTCHIREKASDKVYSELGRLRAIRDARRREGQGEMMIAVAGCVAQAEGEEIRRREPSIDLIFGPQTYHRLPEMLAQRARSTGTILDTDFPPEDKFDHLPEARHVAGVTAFLTIQEGCDKFCSFCVVPYTRGAEASRTVEQVIAEARQLAEKGVREVTLLGQNVNAYRGRDAKGREVSLADLAFRLAEIDGLERIRYTTSHPRDMSVQLIAAHGSNEKLMPFLHLPVQSGSDAILTAMNRQHTVEDYMRTVGELRRARPDIALSSDFIVGFPGETERDFEATLDLVRHVTFAQAYSFKYSKRPGTPAALLAKQIPEPVKEERLGRLQALLIEQQKSFNRSQIGRRLPVLFEKPGRHPGQLIGRSPYLQSVHVSGDGTARVGDLKEVVITGLFPNSLGGVLLTCHTNAAE